MPTPHFSPITDQQAIVVCDPAAITAGDISGVLTALKGLSGDRSSAMSAEGAVTLVFHGYDADLHELEAIPDQQIKQACLRIVKPQCDINRVGLNTVRLNNILRRKIIITC